MPEFYTLVAGPAIEPVTLAEVKVHCRVDHDAENEYLIGLIQTAREQAELELRRALITQTWRLTLDTFPTWAIEITKPPVQSVTSVVYLEGLAGAITTLPTADYVLDTDSEPARLYPGYSVLWPTTYTMPNAVKVTFVAGYPSAAAVPKRIKQGILMLAAHMYENRELVNVGNIVNEIPMSVQRLWFGARWGSYP